MKLRFPMLPATALCALAALSACGVADKVQNDFERQEFVKLCAPELAQRGVPEASRETVCNCVVDKARAYRAANADAAPSPGDVADYFDQCARDAGVPFPEEWPTTSWDEDAG